MLKTRRKPVRLGLESLEERCVPTIFSYYWHPAGGSTNYAGSGNWYDQAGNPTGVVPGTGAIAIFGGAYGTNSPCTIDDSNTVGVLALRSTTAYTSTLTIDITYSVGQFDTGGASGSYWDSGNIQFATGSGYSNPELDIYTPYNSTTKGFRIDGGTVNISTSYTGRVDVFSGATLTLGFEEGNVFWGANLWTQAATGGNAAGEVDFISGGTGQLQWDYVSRTSGSEPTIANHGSIYFLATDASSTISGISSYLNGVPGNARFFNNGLVVFQGGAPTTEGLVFQNGDAFSWGELDITDGTTVLFNQTYSDAAYGSTTIFQMNTGSTTEVYNGDLKTSGNLAFTAGYLKYGNAAGYTNSAKIESSSSTVYALNVDGGTLESDISGGGTTLTLHNMQTILGLNNPSTTKLQFDVDNSSGTIYGKITSDNSLTIDSTAFSHVTVTVNATGGAPSAGTYNFFDYTALNATFGVTWSNTGWTGWSSGPSLGTSHLTAIA